MSQEFLRELEEDIQAARLKRFWDNYGNTLIGVSLALVIGTAGGVAWKSWQTKQNEKYTTMLIAAENDPAKLQAVVKDAANHNQAALAGLRLGALAREKGDAAEAARIYNDIAGNARYDEALRAVASVQASHAMAQAGGEGKALTPDAPLSAERQEAEAWRLKAQSKNAEAKAAFKALVEAPATPLAIVERARLALGEMQ